MILNRRRSSGKRRTSGVVAAMLAGLVAGVALLPAAAQAAPVDLSMFVTGQLTEIAPGQTQQVAFVLPGLGGADPASIRVVVELPTGVTYVGPGRTAGACAAAGA